MEEKNEQKGKLSYEQLNSQFMELNVQYQKLMTEYRRAIDALNSRDMTTYALESMFKVLEHPNRYNERFVSWCTANIEGAVRTIVSELDRSTEPQEKDKKEEKSNEA